MDIYIERGRERERERERVDNASDGFHMNKTMMTLNYA
jgi:hypothetical protein